MDPELLNDSIMACINNKHAVILILTLFIQGEIIDRIESNVEKAADYISDGAQVIQRCVNVANQRASHYCNSISCSCTLYICRVNLIE